MPVPLPNLDDRSYNDLLAEARALIPTYAPEWTNHNASDPGITLVELFAYLADQLLYRVNRVTEDNLRAFLQLLNGPTWTPDSGQTLAEQVRDTVLKLRQPDRAVTCADFENLARAWPSMARAACLPRRNLETGGTAAANTDKPGHVSVVVVPSAQSGDAAQLTELIHKIKDYLEPRRLITTRVHVVGATYFAFGVQLTITLKPDSPATRFLFTVNVASTIQSDIQTGLNNGTVIESLGTVFQTAGFPLSSQSVSVTVQVANSVWVIVDHPKFISYTIRSESNQVNQPNQLNVYENSAHDGIVQALRSYWDPLTGGPEGEGWPFGRNIYVSEIYHLLDALPGIDYVARTLDADDEPLDELTVTSANLGRLERNSNGDLVSIQLYPNELVNTASITYNLDIQVPNA